HLGRRAVTSAEQRTSARANTRIEEGDRDEHAASYTPRERVCSVRAADSHGIRGGSPPTVDSIDTQGCANDRVCVTLTVDNPVAGTITLKLTGHTPGSSVFRRHRRPVAVHHRGWDDHVHRLL